MQIVALAQIIWARCPSSAAADAVENFGPLYVTAAATTSAVVKVDARAHSEVTDFTMVCCILVHVSPSFF